MYDIKTELCPQTYEHMSPLKRWFIPSAELVV